MEPAHPPPAAQPGFAAGRNAAIVHGLAIVAAVAAATGTYFAGRVDEIDAISGVGIAAVGVLWLWSGLLAVRALWKAERPVWPALVLGLMLLETCPLALWYWFEESYGIPVLVPVFALATFIAVPIAWWRVNRAERKVAQASGLQRNPEDGATLPSPPWGEGGALAPGEGAAGDASFEVAPWTRRQRWKRGLIWYVAILLWATILCLPWPLFLYCTSNWTREDRGWRQAVIESLPQFVRDGTAHVVLRLPASSTAGTRSIQEEFAIGVIWRGRLSKEELLKCLSLPDPGIVMMALDELAKVDRAAALEFAIRTLKNGAPNASLVFVAAAVIGQFGDVDLVDSFLRDPASTPTLRSSILSGLRSHYRREMQPLLEELARSGTGRELAIALATLARNAPRKDIERLWTELLNAMTNAQRQEAARCVQWIRFDDLREKLELVCLLHADPLVRYEVLKESMTGYVERGKAQKARWLGHTDALLNEPDLKLRRLAVCALAKLLKIQVRETFNPSFGAATPPLETLAEQEELEQIRQAAKIWLEENSAQGK